MQNLLFDREKRAQVGRQEELEAWMGTGSFQWKRISHQTMPLNPSLYAFQRKVRDRQMIFFTTTCYIAFSSNFNCAPVIQVLHAGEEEKREDIRPWKRREHEKSVRNTESNRSGVQLIVCRVSTHPFPHLSFPSRINTVTSSYNSAGGAPSPPLLLCVCVCLCCIFVFIDQTNSFLSFVCLSPALPSLIHILRFPTTRCSNNHPSTLIKRNICQLSGEQTYIRWQIKEQRQELNSNNNNRQEDNREKRKLFNPRVEPAS